MIPLLLAAIFGIAGYSIGRGTKTTTRVGEIPARPGFVWVRDHWERERATPATPSVQSAIAILQELIARQMPVSPGLATAAWREAMQTGDLVTAQQIALVFFPRPPQQQFQPPPPIMVGEEQSEALQETYSDAEPMKAVTTTIHHNPAPSVQDVTPEEWKEFLLCFKTRDPSFRGDRHIGAFEHATRRLSQLGIDPNSLTTEELQMQALDKDLSGYLQSSERLLNDFTGECITVNGEKLSVTRSGILALLKAAGPAGAKGWLTEEHQRKAFPHTTEIFKRANGRF